MRKEKLIQMAVECAYYWKIHRFEVIPLPPEQVPEGIVQILASSTECDSVSKHSKTDWEGAERRGVRREAAEICSVILTCAEAYLYSRLHSATHCTVRSQTVFSHSGLLLMKAARYNLKGRFL